MLDVLRINRYADFMILSYKDKRTKAFIAGARVKEFHGIERQIFKRLEILDAATELNDLRSLPSNRLEALGGDRAGQWSIRINLQWRLVFAWPQGQVGPSDVEMIDYH